MTDHKSHQVFLCKVSHNSCPVENLGTMFIIISKLHLFCRNSLVVALCLLQTAFAIEINQSIPQIFSTSVLLPYINPRRESN